MTRSFLSLLTIIAAGFGVLCLLSLPANAQRRDFLTDEEVELVRDAQEIDRRTDVLTTAIDRRLAVLNLDAGPAKQRDRDVEKWGERPRGSRLELLGDIKKLLQKAIDDINNVAEHPKSQPIDPEDKKASRRFPDAVRNLAAAAERYLPVLRNALDNTTVEIEKGPILDAIESCNQIIEAYSRMPKTSSNEEKKKAR